MIYFLAEIATSFIEVYIYYSMVCCLRKREMSLKIKLILSSIFTVAILYMNSFSYFSFITFIIFPIALAITAAIVFKYTFKFTLAFSLFYILFIQVYDLILLSCIGLLTGQEDYMTVITTAGYQRFLFLVIDKGMFVGIYLLVKVFLRGKSEIILNKYLLFISMGGFVGAIYLTEQTIKQINLDITLSWVLFSLIIILVIVVMYFYYQRQHEKDALEFAAMRNELLETNYNNLKELYETNSKLFHDFKNHIRVINRLVNENNMEELKEYVAGFELEDHRGDHTIWTEDTVVNFILNNKISLGTQMGIQINANIDLPLKTNIRSSDMTAILANLFDNAIEACSRVPNGNDKKIDVAVRKINGMLLVKFENSCYEKPVKKGNSFLTIKDNKNFHGWGLKSVESTAKKYSGSLDCSYDQEKQIFRTVLNLSFKDFAAVN